MKFSIARSVLLKPLQMVSGVVERKQSLPILSNVLLTVKGNQLFLTGTDIEIELKGTAALNTVSAEGSATVSAKKLFDIVRLLPEDAIVEFVLEKEQFRIHSGKSRFSLATLPAEEFPCSEDNAFSMQFEANQSNFKKLLNKIHFAMGHQDVRHYLNGVLLDIDQHRIQGVATDGHRLAYTAISHVKTTQHPSIRVILPRKCVLELIRLLDTNQDSAVLIEVNDHYFRLTMDDLIFTSKLINAQYPDYTKLIPQKVNHVAIACRETFKSALTRASVLSNEKFRGIRLHFHENNLKLAANNPEQEEAEETLPFEYQGDQTELAFNVAYLLDVVSTITTEKIRCSFKDATSGVLIEAFEQEDPSLYVIMPMRL